MILRRLPLRRGRIALAKPSTPSWRRALATVVEQQTSGFDRIVDAASIDLARSNQDKQSLTPQQGSQRRAARAKDIQAQHEAFARDYFELQEYKRNIRRIGTQIAPHYKPHELLNQPPGPEDVTLELLMASQAHLGHATGLWHPGNARYIYGIRDGIHIISLDVTASHLRRASKIVEETALHGGLILFVGTREGQQRSVVNAAAMAQGCHLFDRWTPGTITNRNQILNKCQLRVVDAGEEDLAGYEDQLGKQAALKPDLVVCLNPLENHVLLRECNQHHIPTIGIIDTDCNPTLVTYPIPANDDSRRCTNVIAGVLGRAAAAGVETRLSDPRAKTLMEQGHNLVDNDGAEESQEPEEAELDEETETLSSKAEALDKSRALPSTSPLAEEEREERRSRVAVNAAAELADFAEDDYAGGAFLREFTDTEVVEGQEKVEAAGQAGQGKLDPLVHNVLSDSVEEGEEVDKEVGQIVKQMDAVAMEYADSQMTDGELSRLLSATAELEAKGLQVQKVERSDTIAEAQRKLAEAADPQLAKLVAMKRRAMGETMTEAEQKIIAQIEKQEVRTRQEMEEFKTQARAEIDDAREQALAATGAVQAAEAKDADARGIRDESERRRRTTAHYDDRASIGPVQKRRRGRPDER